MPKQDKVQRINQRRPRATDMLGVSAAGAAFVPPGTITAETDNSVGTTHTHKLDVDLVELGHIILIVAVDGSMVDYGVAGDDALTAALAAASAGDVVWLPACTVSGDHVVPAGVTLCGLGRASVLTGQLTLYAGAEARGLCIERDVSDAADIVGVTNGGAAVAYLVDMMVSVDNALGNGYAVSAGTGGLHVYGGSLYGSTAPVK